MYRSFNAWTAHAFWRMELPLGELPDLVACTDSMVFVYTSRGYLRTWSVGGSSEPLLPEEMEWVVLMNVKHYLREQQERGDARTA